MLLTVDDWTAGDRRGTCHHGRVSRLWRSTWARGALGAPPLPFGRMGETEALGLAPGIPDIEAQEKRDRVSSGTYGSLVSAGLLHVADGLRVQPPSMLADLITETWGPACGCRRRPFPSPRIWRTPACTVWSRV